jgi:uncharacterized protein (DUF934 family)
MAVIKDGRIAADPWITVAEDGTLPEGEALLVSYEVWERQRDVLRRRNGRVGVRLAAGQSPHLLAGDLERIDLIALDFPTLRDGRAYSAARLLRERHGYTGELRATGQVLRDQFLFMHRCGFDSYEVTDPEVAGQWAEALAEISGAYQPAGDERRAVLMAGW